VVVVIVLVVVVEVVVAVVVVLVVVAQEVIVAVDTPILTDCHNKHPCPQRKLTSGIERCHICIHRHIRLSSFVSPQDWGEYCDILYEETV
jgi:hypothetical protein